MARYDDRDWDDDRRDMRYAYGRYSGAEASDDDRHRKERWRHRGYGTDWEAGRDTHRDYGMDRVSPRSFDPLGTSISRYTNAKRDAELIYDTPAPRSTKRGSGSGHD